MVSVPQFEVQSSAPRSSPPFRGERAGWLTAVCPALAGWRFHSRSLRGRSLRLAGHNREVGLDQGLNACECGFGTGDDAAFFRIGQ